MLITVYWILHISEWTKQDILKNVGYSFKVWFLYIILLQFSEYDILNIRNQLKSKNLKQNIMIKTIQI